MSAVFKLDINHPSILTTPPIPNKLCLGQAESCGEAKAGAYNSPEGEETKADASYRSSTSS